MIAASTALLHGPSEAPIPFRASRRSSYTRLSPHRPSAREHLPPRRPRPSPPLAAKKRLARAAATSVAAVPFAPAAALATADSFISGAAMGSPDAPESGLLVTCALLFAGAYGSGLLPRLLPVSANRLLQINAVSAGLLLGSGLCVILPEGFEALHAAHVRTGGGCILGLQYSDRVCMRMGPGRHDETPSSLLYHHLHLLCSTESQDSLPEWSAGLALLGGFWLMLLIDGAVQQISGGGSSGSWEGRDGGGRGGGEEGSWDDQTQAIEMSRDLRAAERGGGGSSSGGAVRARASSSPPRKGAPRPSANAALAGPAAAGPSASQSGSSRELLQPPASQQPAFRQLLATRGGAVLLGLLVHSAADGLAVGSAALARQPSVSLAVAAGMILHKLPVSVGLSSFLSAAAWPWPAVNKALLAFAAASPIAALATFVALSHLGTGGGGGGGEGGEGGDPAVALALLVSGGTVLFAATVHVLPEALAAAGAEGHGGAACVHPQADGGGLGGDEEQERLMGGGGGGESSGGGAVHRRQQQELQQQRRRDVLLWMTAGALLPLLLSAGIHHDHGGGGGEHEHHDR
jgi:hypothetical protein